MPPVLLNYVPFLLMSFMSPLRNMYLSCPIHLALLLIVTFSSKSHVKMVDFRGFTYCGLADFVTFKMYEG